MPPRTTRACAAAVAAVALVVVSAATPAMPPWKVLAWGNSPGSCSHGTFVARTSAEAAEGVACLHSSLARVVRSVDYRRFFVVGALNGYGDRDWQIEITDIWRPRGIVAVDAHVIAPPGRPLSNRIATAYQVVRLPRSAFPGAIPPRAELAVDRFPFRIATLDARPLVVGRGRPVTLEPYYSSHPPRFARFEMAVYARSAGGNWRRVAHRVTDGHGDTPFEVRPRAPTDYRATASSADGTNLLAWSAPVHVAIATRR